MKPQAPFTVALIAIVTLQLFLTQNHAQLEHLHDHEPQPEVFPPWAQPLPAASGAFFGFTWES